MNLASLIIVLVFCRSFYHTLCLSLSIYKQNYDYGLKMNDDLQCAAGAATAVKSRKHVLFVMHAVMRWYLPFVTSGWSLGHGHHWQHRGTSQSQRGSLLHLWSSLELREVQHGGANRGNLGRKKTGRLEKNPFYPSLNWLNRQLLTVTFFSFLGTPHILAVCFKSGEICLMRSYDDCDPVVRKQCSKNITYT